MSAGSDSVAGVVQSDRDAAAEFSKIAAQCGEKEPRIVSCRAGKEDDSYIVQAFARHRIDSQAELLEALENARDAIREMRLADAHANRTGEEVRFDRAFAALLNLQKPINAAIAKARSPQ